MAADARLASLVEGHAYRFAMAPDHVANGDRKNECRCPVALALKDALGVEFWVGKTRIEIVTGPSDIDGWFPTKLFAFMTDEAREFINAFDAGGSPEPIEIEVVAWPADPGERLKPDAKEEHVLEPCVRPDRTHWRVLEELDLGR